MALLLQAWAFLSPPGLGLVAPQGWEWGLEVGRRELFSPPPQFLLDSAILLTGIQHCIRPMKSKRQETPEARWLKERHEVSKKWRKIKWKRLRDLKEQEAERRKEYMSNLKFVPHLMSIYGPTLSLQKPTVSRKNTHCACGNRSNNNHSYLWRRLGSDSSWGSGDICVLCFFWRPYLVVDCMIKNLRNN